jgi:hypothetical protein
MQLTETFRPRPHVSRKYGTLWGASLVSCEFSVGRRKKEKAGNLSAPAPKTRSNVRFYGPEILAWKTANRISTQQVIIQFQYHEYRLAVNGDPELVGPRIRDR